LRNWGKKEKLCALNTKKKHGGREKSLHRGCIQFITKNEERTTAKKGGKVGGGGGNQVQV